MKLKHALWVTLAWTLLALGGSIAGLVYIMNNPIPGANTDRRAELLGQGTGMVMMIGYAVIWLPYIIRVSKRRREEMQREEQEEKARKRRPPGSKGRRDD